jgi:DedD protein
MSDESKKLLWISIAVVLGILGVSLMALFLFAPAGKSATAPASLGNLSVPKAADPQDYLNAPAAPLSEAPRTGSDDLIVIYGEKPASIPPAAGAAANSQDPTTIPATTPGSASTPVPAPLPTNGWAAPSASPQPLPSATAAAKPAPAKPAPSPKPAVQSAPAKPAASSQAVKTSAPAKPAAKVDEYWIQAASFSSRGRADELKSSLAQKGVAALIAVKDIDGKSWYRVRIGPYGTKAEADGWVARIKSVPGCTEAYVAKTQR